MQRKSFVAAWQKGFTLIELLVVIGILGILMAVVIVAVNPARQFASARDTQRRADLSALTSAIYQYAIAHNGNLPAVPGTPPTPVITTTAVDASALSTYLVPDYISVIPADPSSGVQYQVMLDADGRVVASASSELSQGQYISITR